MNFDNNHNYESDYDDEFNIYQNEWGHNSYLMPINIYGMNRYV